MKYAEEILQAAEADQALRLQFRPGTEQADLRAKITNVDTQNTQLMQRIIADIGWPTIPKVGDKASHAAWLLVQHADRDRAFQRRCLEFMQAEPRDDVRQSNIAYLTDRLLVSENKPQLYGTQYHYAEASKRYEPKPIQDPDTVDARRAIMGLGTLAENITEINELKPEGTKESSLL